MVACVSWLSSIVFLDAFTERNCGMQVVPWLGLSGLGFWLSLDSWLSIMSNMVLYKAFSETPPVLQIDWCLSNWVIFGTFPYTAVV